MHVGRPVIRGIRAAAFTAVCVLTSALLHMLVSGTAIKPQALAIAVGATWAGAYAAGRRQHGWPVLLALCGASQYGMHQLFAAYEDPAREAPYGDAVREAVYGDTAWETVSWAASLAEVAPGHAHGGGLGMVAVHLAVAAGSSWWLARGDQALATLLKLATVRVGNLWALLWAALAVLTYGPSGERPGPMPVWPDTARRVSVLLSRTVSRRGPPAALPRALG